MSDRNKQLAGSIYLILAFFLAGTSVVCGKYLNRYLGIFTISAISLLIATLALLPVNRGRILASFRQMKSHQWAILVLQALFGIFIFRFLMLMGLGQTSATEAGLLTGATPAITTILAWLLLREAITRIRLIGILCTIAGIVCIEIRSPAAGIFFVSDHLAGNILVILAAASESTFNIISRASHVRRDHVGIDPLISTVFVSAMAFLMCLFPAMTEDPLARLAVLPWTGWLAIIWYGVFVTGVAFVFFFAGIRRKAACDAAAFSGMMPFTALLLAVCLLGEPVKLHQIAGGVLVIFGMILLSGVLQKKIA